MIFRQPVVEDGARDIDEDSMNAGVTGISEKLTLSLGGDTVRDLKCSSLRYFRFINVQGGANYWREGQ